MNHADSDSFEADSCNLVEETSHDEINLAERCNRNTDDYTQDIGKFLEIWLVDTNEPASNEDSNWSESLRNNDQCLFKPLAADYRTLSIWMKETLRYKYVRFPQIKLMEKKTPIGTIARRYILPVILTLWRPSRRVVVRDMICVTIVEKIRCHAVRRIG